MGIVVNAHRIFDVDVVPSEISQILQIVQKPENRAQNHKDDRSEHTVSSQPSLPPPFLPILDHLQNLMIEPKGPHQQDNSLQISPFIEHNDIAPLRHLNLHIANVLHQNDQQQDRHHDKRQNPRYRRSGLVTPEQQRVAHQRAKDQQEERPEIAHFEVQTAYPFDLAIKPKLLESTKIRSL